MTDFRQMQVGEETNIGTIKSIYACTEDFIVFLNDENEPRILTNGNDGKFNIAWDEAKRQSAKVLGKFNKVHLKTTTDLIANGLVSALLADNNNESDVESYFEQIRKFIDTNKKVIRVFGESPNQHKVYMTDDNCVDWEIKTFPDYTHNAISEMTNLRSLSECSLPNFFRSSASGSIGSAVTSIIRSNSNSDLKHIVQRAKEHVEAELIDFFHMEHQAINIIFLVILFWIGLINIEQESTSLEYLVLMGAIGGALGALISNLQRAKRKLFGFHETLPKLLLQSLSRLLLGAISGSIVIPLSKSNFALGIVKDNIYGLFIFCLIAGLFERFIPDTLGGLSKSGKE